MSDEGSRFHTRPSLLLRVRDPLDAASWRTFVDVYGPLVYGHCRRLRLRHEDAEDVTQRAFSRVMQAIGGFDYRSEAGRFRDWLGTIVQHEIYRFWRQSRRRTDGIQPDDAGALERVEAKTADTAWNEEFNAHVLRTALDRSRPRFEPDTWRAFELLWLEDRPAGEVAKELRRTIDWVYVAKSRVLKLLSAEVRELSKDG